MGHPFFAAPPPKSLEPRRLVPRGRVVALDRRCRRDADRLHGGERRAGRSTTSPSGRASRWSGGGGARNPALMRALAEALPCRVAGAAEHGWDGDAIEAQAFAYLAVRSRLGLPITFPGHDGRPGAHGRRGALPGPARRDAGAERGLAAGSADAELLRARPAGRASAAGRAGFGTGHEEGLRHGHHGTGRRLSGRTPARQGLRGPRPSCAAPRPRTVNDHRLRWLGIADRVRLVDGDLTDLSGLIRSVREVMPDEVYKPRRPVLRQVVVAAAAADRHRHRPRRRQHAGGGPPGLPGGAVLPGVLLGDVRPDPGARAERDDALLPPLALRGRQALRPLDDGELPRKLRPPRLQRHPVQP